MQRLNQPIYTKCQNIILQRANMVLFVPDRHLLAQQHPWHSSSIISNRVPLWTYWCTDTTAAATMPYKYLVALCCFIPTRQTIGNNVSVVDGDENTPYLYWELLDYTEYECVDPVAGLIDQTIQWEERAAIQMSNCFFEKLPLSTKEHVQLSNLVAKLSVTTPPHLFVHSVPLHLYSFVIQHALHELLTSVGCAPEKLGTQMDNEEGHRWKKTKHHSDPNDNDDDWMFIC